MKIMIILTPLLFFFSQLAFADCNWKAHQLLSGKPFGQMTSQDLAMISQCTPGCTLRPITPNGDIRARIVRFPMNNPEFTNAYLLELSSKKSGKLRISTQVLLQLNPDNTTLRGFRYLATGALDEHPFTASIEQHLIGLDRWVTKNYGIAESGITTDQDADEFTVTLSIYSWSWVDNGTLDRGDQFDFTRVCSSYVDKP